MDREAYQNAEADQIKVAMSQMFRHYLPSNWQAGFHDRMASDYNVKAEKANTREAIIGLLREEYDIAVICTSVEDALQELEVALPSLEERLRDEILKDRDNVGARVEDLHAEVAAVDGFSLICALSEDDPLIKSMTEGVKLIGRGLATTKAKLRSALRCELVETYRFAVREEGSGTRTYIERHILTGIVRSDADKRWRYGDAKTSAPYHSNTDMVVAVRGSDASEDKLLAIVADSILEQSGIDMEDILRVRILGVDRPFCLVRRADSAEQKEILACCDFIREKEAMRRPHSRSRFFIGHGHSDVWKELRDFIQGMLRKPCDEFNRVPVAGVTNIARLSRMMDEAAFAFLVMTAEDEQSDGSVRARENVIHEAGLFQGQLGFKRAIILREEGCGEFSNIHGLQQILFPEGRISEAFERIRDVLDREKMI